MTGLPMVVVTAGSTVVGTVVVRVSGVPSTGCGSATSFLVVVASCSEVEISSIVVWVVVAVAAVDDVAEVRIGFDVTGRRGTSVVLVEETTSMAASEETSVVVSTVGL